MKFKLKFQMPESPSLVIRNFTTLLNRRNTNLYSKSIPIPHKTIEQPQGIDHDFITVAYSHIINAEWQKLNSFAHKLTPLRVNHLLVKLQKDPVVSFQFYNFALSENPDASSVDTHVLILHILTKFGRFKSAELILKDILIPKTVKTKDFDLFDAILYSYHLCDSSPNVFDSLFKTYAHLKKFRYASDTFCRMRDYGFLPTIKTCNAFISSLLGLGRTDIALSFYKEMGKSRISPNVYTMNLVVSAFCKSGRLDKAQETFEKMESIGFSPIVSSYNTLITAFCKNGIMSDALKLKNDMNDKGLIPNEITYNTLIHGFCKEGKLNEAYKVFNEMKTMRLKANTVTYNTLIRGYGHLNDGEMGLKIYEDMVKNKVDVDMLTYNSLILGLCNEGKTKKAAYLVKELEKAKFTPDSSTFSALISGQCKRKNSDRAFQIYKVMKKSGCHPNHDTLNKLASTFCKNNDFEGALDVLKDIIKRNIKPDNSLLIEIFEGLNVSGKGDLLVSLIKEPKAQRLVPKDLVDHGVDSLSKNVNG